MPLWEIFDLTFNQFKSEYQCLVQLSFVANHQDNFVRQEDMLRLAVALYKSDVMVWQFLLENQKHLRKWNELVKVGNEALELFPTDAEIYYFTGLGYLKLQDYSRSLELLTPGRDLVIEDPELLSQFYSSLGSVYFKTDNVTFDGVPTEEIETDEDIEVHKTCAADKQPGQESRKMCARVYTRAHSYSHS
jgi:tetratricopeptide (TPR) repeat protein